MGSLISWVRDWWARPFNSAGSAFDWFLFVGLLLIIMVIWQQILRHIPEMD